MLNYSLKFITSDDSLRLKNIDLKSYKYETKKKQEESVYDNGKRSYCEKRGGNWISPHPRQIRQLDTKLRDCSIAACEWTTESLVTLVFSTGVIAYITVKPDTLDVLQILFDRYCVGKLSGQTVTGVAICQSCLFLTHPDKLATLITFNKKASSSPCRISDRDPQIQTIELGTRRSDRKISCHKAKDGPKVLIWSSHSSTEPAPWSPVLEDQANLHLYDINGQNISLVAYHQLENETLLAELSDQSDTTVHIVEQTGSSLNGVNIYWFRYEVENSSHAPRKLQWCPASETRGRLPAAARAVRRVRGARLLAACLDGTLHVLHARHGLTHTVRAGFIPTEVWLAGELVVAASESGRLQCFDQALSLLHHHTKCFDLSSYFGETKRMQVLATREAKAGPVLLVSFGSGPLALLHITHPRLLTTWIRIGRPANAVALIQAMNWEVESVECVWAINKIVCSALRSGSSARCEEEVSQAALGAWVARRPPPAASALPLARKFHHHLLRRGRIEKALSLAVDLRAWDLAADARWAAARRGLHALAGEGAALAAQFAPDSDYSESCSQCSSQSYTDDEGDSTRPEIKTNPPPLPRVSLTNVMSVPITQYEPTSTNSIRPNLHQYLDRDDTIWTQNIEDTYVKISGPDKIKPILTQNIKKMENSIMNPRLGSLSTLGVINEMPSKPISTVSDIVSRPLNGINSTQSRLLYNTDFNDETLNTLYRYNNNNYQQKCIKEKCSNIAERGSRQEKTKVKFSDTVTIAVVSEPEASGAAGGAGTGRPTGTTHDYVHV